MRVTPNGFTFAVLSQNGHHTLERLGNEASGQMVLVHRYRGRAVSVRSSYAAHRADGRVTRRRRRKAARAARKTNR